MDYMDKKALLAIVLSLIVLVSFQFFASNPPPPQQAGSPAQDVKGNASVSEPATLQTTPHTAKAEFSAPSREITVNTELYTAVVTSKGGTIRRFDLKKYRDKDGISVSLLKTQGAYPALGIGFNADNLGLSNVNFDIKGSDLTLEKSQKGAITVEYASQQVKIRRSFIFYGDSYKIDVTDEVAGMPDYVVALGQDFGIADPKDSSAPHIGPVILKDTDRIELTAKQAKDPKTYRDNLRWAALEDKYFFAAVVPSNQTIEALVTKTNDSASVFLRNKAGLNNYMVYAGPKDYDALDGLHLGLEHIIDFGFFSIIARPLFWIMKFFYKFMGNYGWVIILLTILVRVPFIPIVNKGQKSMKRMQEIQPKLNELREKYKKDPARMQKETMEIYKKYKVNPLSGCLPMLLQLPVFFALYKVLLIAIELRGAPFMLWITDLSAKDPYYILPIVMGITMVIQQKMTPTSVDPRQAKMMMIMPVVFTLMFLNFASGLVLYWLVNNILGIAQQFYSNKKTA